MAGRVCILGGHGVAPLYPWNFLLDWGLLLVRGQVLVDHGRLVRRVLRAGRPSSEPIPQSRHAECCVNSADARPVASLNFPSNAGL